MSEDDRRKKLESFIGSFSIEFSDWALLERVFIHSSYVNEVIDDSIESNERLEFLGDAVVELVISDMLYRRFPMLDEGALTRLRASLVNKKILALLAKELSLGDLLLLGKGEDKDGGRENPSVLSDTLEALVGAIFMDGGFSVVDGFIREVFSERFDRLNADDKVVGHFDFKPRLQELVQRNFTSKLRYRLKDSSGPAHEKVFVVEAIVGEEVFGQGSAGSKKEAEQSAAKQALEALKERGYEE